MRWLTGVAHGGTEAELEDIVHFSSRAINRPLLLHPRVRSGRETYLVLEVERKGAAQSAAWSIAFKEPRQAEAFAAFYSQLAGGKSHPDAVALEQKAGSVSAVAVRGSTAVVLSGVPLDLARLVERL